jgi:Coenzyme PQQ synthesis protein D (PqqD)
MHARRLPVVDEYAEDGRVAVFSERGMVLVLSELATLAWAELGADWTDVDDVAAALVAEFGAPEVGEGPRAATEAALRTLAQHGLVELADTDRGRGAGRARHGRRLRPRGTMGM